MTKEEDPLLGIDRLSSCFKRSKFSQRFGIELDVTSYEMRKDTFAYVLKILCNYSSPDNVFQFASALATLMGTTKQILGLIKISTWWCLSIFSQ